MFSLFAGIGILELLHIDLLHCHHRLHHPGGGFALTAADHFGHALVVDLPDRPETVLYPAAGLFLAAARQQLAVQLIDLGLAVAPDQQRTGGAVLELRPAIDGGEFLTIEDEADRHHAALGAGPGI